MGNRRLNRRACVTLFGMTVVTALLTGCLPEVPPVEAPQVTDAPVSEPVQIPQVPSTLLLEVVDGDTLRTSEGSVRIIGVDAPERGECGYREAITAIEQVMSVGDEIELHLPDGQKDTDAYDRLLRYVSTDTVDDLGLMLVAGGHAVARYDSTDGYPHHPLEDEYRESQVAELIDGSIVTPDCRAAESEHAPLGFSAAPEANEDPWYMQYRSCSQLKKNSVGHPKGPFNVNSPAEKEIYDWFQYGTGFKGDGDGDGLACE